MDAKLKTMRRRLSDLEIPSEAWDYIRELERFQSLEPREGCRHLVSEGAIAEYIDNQIYYYLTSSDLVSTFIRRPGPDNSIVEFEGFLFHVMEPLWNQEPTSQNFRRVWGLIDPAMDHDISIALRDAYACGYSYIFFRHKNPTNTILPVGSTGATIWTP